MRPLLREPGQSRPFAPLSVQVEHWQREALHQAVNLLGVNDGAVVRAALTAFFAHLAASLPSEGKPPAWLRTLEEAPVGGVDPEQIPELTAAGSTKGRARPRERKRAGP